MPKKIQQEFDPWSKKGKLFIKMWNGPYKKLTIAQHFNISVPTVKRIARSLNLPKKNHQKHPYKEWLNRRIKKMYLKGHSTINIARILSNSSTFRNKIHDETVRRKLHYMGIVLRKKSEKDVYINDYSSLGNYHYKPKKLIKEITRLYNLGLPPIYIAKLLGVEKNTVIRRLKVLGLEVPTGSAAWLKNRVKHFGNKISEQYMKELQFSLKVDRGEYNAN